VERGGDELPAKRSGSLVALVALSAVSTLSFARLFDGRSWVLPVLLAVAGAHAVGLITRRLPSPVGILISAGVLFLVIANVVTGHTTFYGIPKAETIDALARAWTKGAEGFRHAVAPTDVTDGLLMLSVLGTWVCASGAHWLAFRGGATLGAIVPPFVLYVVAATLGTAGLQGETTFVFVVAALVFVASHHAAGMPTTWFSGRHAPPGAVRIALSGVAPIAVFVAAAGLLLGPNLPGAQAEAWLPVRGTGGGGDESRITVSPLVDMKARLTQTPVTELFTVRSPQAWYWRLTALENFDGRIWSSRGTYRPADGLLPGDGNDPDLVYEIPQDFQIGPLESFWLPAAYRPVEVELDGARVNKESLTLLTEEESAAGLTYRVTSAIPRYSAADLLEAPAATSPEVEPYLELPADFPSDVKRLAENITRSAKGPYEAALALQRHLRDNYKYNEEAVAGHSADHLRYFLFRTKEGYCEQFAGAFAAMARSVGLPSRVAVGFTPGRYDAGSDIFRVSTREAHAWPEVYITDRGWVAFEPTPGRYEPNPTNYTGTYSPVDAPGLGSTTTTTSPAEATPGSGTTSRPTLPESGEDVGSEEDSLAENGASWLPRLAIAMVVAAVVVAIPPIVKSRRRRRRRLAGTTAARVAGAWSEALDRLREVGTVPVAAYTPMEFARRAPSGRPELVGPMGRLAGVFTRVAYSPGEPSDADADAAWSEVEALTEALDAGDTRMARLKRRLNPLTLIKQPG
jgi:transglutaminase-like putative cysteine protease